VTRRHGAKKRVPVQFRRVLVQIRTCLTSFVGTFIVPTRYIFLNIYVMHIYLCDMKCICIRQIHTYSRPRRMQRQLAQRFPFRELSGRLLKAPSAAMLSKLPVPVCVFVYTWLATRRQKLRAPACPAEQPLSSSADTKTMVVEAAGGVTRISERPCALASSSVASLRVHFRFSACLAAQRQCLHARLAQACMQARTC